MIDSPDWGVGQLDSSFGSLYAVLRVEEVKMRRLILPLFALLLTSCAAHSTRSTFLQENVNRITQDGIEKAWGPPQSVTKLIDGSPVWIYRVVQSGRHGTYIPPRPSGSAVSGGSTFVGAGRGIERGITLDAAIGTPDLCAQYVLTFDSSGKLQEWSRVACKP